MERILFTPFGIAAGLLAGFLGKFAFDRVWALIDDQEPPEPEHREIVRQLHQELTTCYDLPALEQDVLASQSRRRLVAEALQRGTTRPWDFAPDPEQRYVRGDFWNALAYGQIRPDARVPTDPAAG